MSKFDDNIKDKRVLSHPLLDGYRAWTEEDYSKPDELTDIFSGSGNPYNKKKSDLRSLVADAVMEIQDQFAQFDIPRQPDVRFIKNTEMKYAKYEPDQVLEGKLVFEAEFLTLTGVKKHATIPVSISGGEVVPPSTMVVNGRIGVISEHEVSEMIERATAYMLPQVRNTFDPPMNGVQREMAVQVRNENGWQPTNTESRNYLQRKNQSKKAYDVRDKIYGDPADVKSPINLIEMQDELTELAEAFIEGYTFNIQSMDDINDDFAVFSTSEPELIVRVVSTPHELTFKLMDADTDEALVTKSLSAEDLEEEPDYEAMSMEGSDKTAQFMDIEELKNQIDQAAGDADAIADIIFSADPSQSLELMDHVEKSLNDPSLNLKLYKMLNSGAPEGSNASWGLMERLNSKTAQDLDRSFKDAVSDLVRSSYQQYETDLMDRVSRGWYGEEKIQEYNALVQSVIDSAVSGGFKNWGTQSRLVELSDFLMDALDARGETRLDLRDLVDSVDAVIAEYHEELNTPDRVVSKRASLSVPSAYAAVVELLEEAEDQKLDTFPRAYDHLLRNYILQVVSVASKDQWMIPLINDGFCLNPYGQNLRTRKASSFKVLDRIKRAQEIEKEVEMEVTDEPVDMAEPKYYRDTRTPIEISDGVRFPDSSGNMRGTVVEFNPDGDYLIIKSKGMEFRVDVESVEPLPSTFKKMYK